MLFVKLVEIGHTVKTAFHRHLCHIQVFFLCLYEFLRFGKAEKGHVFAERAACHFSEITAEIRRAHVRKSSSLLQRDRFHKVTVDIIQSLFKASDLFLFFVKQRANCCAAFCK